MGREALCLVELDGVSERLAGPRADASSHQDQTNNQDDAELSAKDVKMIGAAKSANTVFLGVDTPADLRHLTRLRDEITDDAAVWLIRPKGKDAAVTESQSRAAGLAAGFVDVKVVSFDATRSAEKYVIPVAKRSRR